MRTSQLPGVLTPILAQFDLELEAVEVIPAGKRQLLRVVVDGDGATGTGPLLDDLAEASKALSAALDSSDVVGSAAYTLEVSTRGISRPLERPAHWRRNRGRLVAVTTTDGATVTGRIIGSDEQTARLDVDGQPQAVALADVSKALVQVELNRRVEGDSAVEEE
jgi:ribosome maturation factor RimP